MGLFYYRALLLSPSAPLRYFTSLSFSVDYRSLGTFNDPFPGIINYYC